MKSQWHSLGTLPSIWSGSKEEKASPLWEVETFAACRTNVPKNLVSLTARGIKEKKYCKDREAIPSSPAFQQAHSFRNNLYPHLTINRQYLPSTTTWCLRLYAGISHPVTRANVFSVHLPGGVFSSVIPLSHDTCNQTSSVATG